MDVKKMSQQELIQRYNDLHQTFDFGDIDYLDNDGELTEEFLSLLEEYDQIECELDRRLDDGQSKG